MRWTRNVTQIGKKLNSCRILVGKTEGKRPLGRTKHKKKFFKAIGREGRELK
jgi:hypothetical protein